MYKDVTADIDKNTTGAKNRAADSISFSDVDVTEVVQTGEKTFKGDLPQPFMISIMVMIQNSSHQEISRIKSLGHVMWNTLVTMIATLT